MYYTKQAYKHVDADQIAEQIRSEGFDPILIHDRPHYIYPPHEHPETKLLVFLEGSMEVTIENQSFQCAPGDRVYIPGNTTHAAKVGGDGCVFYWSEKIL